jgi:hypothetical protein
MAVRQAIYSELGTGAQNSIDSRFEQDYRAVMAETPKHDFRCPDSLWDALKRIAADRGKELMIDPRLMVSSVIRMACEEYVARYDAAKQAAFEAELDAPVKPKAKPKK